MTSIHDEMHAVLANVKRSENTELMLSLFGEKYRPKMGVSEGSVLDEAAAMMAASEPVQHYWWMTLSDLQQEFIIKFSGTTPTSWITQMYSRKKLKEAEIQPLLDLARKEIEGENAPLLGLLATVAPEDAKQTVDLALEILEGLLRKRVQR